ncbi:hypothetical protein D3C71_2015610 [compost metagenome]
MVQPHPVPKPVGGDNQYVALRDAAGEVLGIGSVADTRLAPLLASEFVGRGAEHDGLGISRGSAFDAAVEQGQDDPRGVGPFGIAGACFPHGLVGFDQEALCLP